MKKKPSVGRIGSVSHGTMRPEDLIPRFLDAADGLRLPKADRPMLDAIRKRADARADKGLRWNGGAGEAKPDLTDDERDEQDYDLETLFAVLDRCAPAYCYFGAHEGDGSDYGWWVSEDALDSGVNDGDVLTEATNGFRTWYVIGRKRCESKAELAAHVRENKLHWQYRLVVSDHGNQTLYTRRGREVWGVV